MRWRWPGADWGWAGARVADTGKIFGSGPLVNKAVLREEILQQLKQELARQTTAAVMARDEAISEESRAESKWDTHSQEAAYLAEGQAKLAGEIRASIELYSALPLPGFGPSDPVAIGAVVELESGPAGRLRRARYLLGPRAGGLAVVVDGGEVLVLTPQSPLGREVLGRRAGEVWVGGGRGLGATQRIIAVY